MITINYQRFGTKGFQLRLRLYQDGETKFINVTKLLKGNIQRRHWNQQKQLFIPSCPFSDENNTILVQFRQKYDQMAINWNGSVFGMIAAMESAKEEVAKNPTVSHFIQTIVDELNKRKHPDGTKKGSFEAYEKCERRLRDFCKAKKLKYEKLLITELTPGFVDSLFAWIEHSRKGKGKNYVSTILHSIVMKAEKAGYLNFEDFKNCDWWKKTKGSIHKFNTLTGKSKAD